MVPQKQPNPVGLSPTATIPELQQSGSFVDRRKWHFQESGFQITSLLLVFAKCQLCLSTKLPECKAWDQLSGLELSMLARTPDEHG
jgi:hypothetical protein